ncbi:3-hydroxyacyl-CoA dehydrogenase/enoyl-CoA hydratase family protein [Acidocella aromatica]|uniref:3-hydroxyacyl-CoA dehydrogenase n=1 Tax=Acidocella aromatica TaxID=1303579 RepID=A0A840V910_9PROT|nr:3-hydroxyacyl-CoA dehydrogenase/enoyl-CoA hydratase family protein [Acidocella aromatica]MBB5371974.1 3-hydroxyacyl-CoA dehydrogenase [Acidocella aromatica]
MPGIQKAAVIGAGTMGAAIAAHFANAGTPVLLLDIVPGAAAGAIAKMQKTDPAPFMSSTAVKLVTPGNLEEDIAKLVECDWIVEAIVERLDLKQDLYRKIDAVRRPGSVVSSNTSTIPLAKLVEGLPESFARNFLITHFFNPPRYMRLLELVTGPATDPALADGVARFADIALGKTVVRAKDSPGFIANRLGVYWLQCGVIEALDAGIAVEAADAIMGRPFGIPKTGVFGLIDLVGLDLMPHINASLAATLPQGDAFHAANRDLPLIKKMIAEGYTGRKGKGGFYRKGAAGREAIDLATGDYRPVQKADLPEAKLRDLRALLSAPSPAARYAWRVLGQTLAYAATLVPEAAEDITSIDEAMRLGYNWKFGPFELIDKLGADWLAEKLAAEGMAVPPLLAAAKGKSFYTLTEGQQNYLGTDGAYHKLTRPEGVLLLADIKRVSKPVLKNASAAVWDIGDGVFCFELTSKSNSWDQQNLEILGKAVELKPKALVLYNEGAHFSVGANLGLAIFAANIAAWGEIEKLVAAGQQVFKAMKYAPFPVVAAPFGMALGGGCEVVLHADAVQAHAETYIGLVECGVGLVPGWGGCSEMLARWAAAPGMPRGPMPAAAKVFEIVSTATVSKSAAQAKELLFLRAEDGITMNRDRLLADAKARALKLAENYTPPTPPTYRLGGEAAQLAFESAAEGFRARGAATTYDMVVSSNLATVLSGGPADLIDEVSEQDILALERAAFMRLIKNEGTLARIEHMLVTGKPLRN